MIDITLIFDAHSKIVARHQHRYIVKSIIITNISPIESGQSNDKVLRREAYLFLVEPYLVDVLDVTFLPIAWQNLSNEGIISFQRLNNYLYSSFQLILDSIKSS